MKKQDFYMIVRYYRKNKLPTIQKTGLTLEQAKEHCAKESTRKAGVYFEGFTKQDSLR